ncbi:MAG: hypothetical protein MR658_03455 [Campylobacter sp.]|uniref:hypothetical protein n=1 Tax=Campylobacter sp. TaxID=205 RepID=UPI002AA79271|nr:hypothetical protein [Campylobacter sp.]MCI6177869.1 hypothetical protein [Campylobacter sp.]MCI7501081.1 hypothetical protein [Campylobacter sp.]
MLGIIFLGGYFVLVLIFSYFWSLVIYKLAISKKIHFIILAIGLYALWGYYTFWDKRLFIISGFFVTALYFAAFMFFRKDFSKKLVIFSSFVCVFCLWQLEVPQSIILYITHKNSNLNIKIIDNNYKIITINDKGKIKKNILFSKSEERFLCKWKKIGCPFIFSFSYPLYDIYIYDNINFTGNKKVIAKAYGGAYNHTFLSGLGSISSIGTGIVAYRIDHQEDEIINFLKENQIKQGENNDKK